MRALSRRRSVVLVSAVALCLSAAAFGLSTAGADENREPAALAARGTLTLQNVRTLTSQATHSSVRGSALKISRGQASGATPQIGGSDEIIAGLTGSLSPVAIESNDGNAIVYSSWHQISNPDPAAIGQGLNEGDAIGVPSLRVYNGVNGVDTLLETAAYSPALSLDGNIAFVRANTPTVRQNVDYEGQIVVSRLDTTTSEKPPSGDQFQQWTNESARYFTYGWAGSTLLAYKSLPESEAADVYGFEGPHASRLIAPDASVVAISPDGSRLLVTVGRRLVEIVDTDGSVLASMALDGEGVAADDSPTTPHALMFAGSWYGDRVVANSDIGLVVLDVHDGIQIESVFTTPGFATGITEPTLLDDTHLIGWAELGSLPASGVNVEPEYDNALVECDLTALSCNVGPASPARTWTRWVTNPSR